MKYFVLVAAIAGCWSKPPRIDDDGFDDAVQLAAGRKHACATDGSHQLWCWGNNEHAQLGDPADLRTGTPRLEMSEKRWMWLAAGDFHTCGITTDAELWCWGDDRSGQVGHGLGETKAAPFHVELPDGGEPFKVYAGSVGTCAIDTAGRLSCWGIYDSDLAVHQHPTVVAPAGIASHWRSVALGESHACALNDDDNRVYCWGENHAGELGVLEMGSVAAADARAKSDREFVSIAAGPSATCGITLARKLVCFGDSARGLIGPAPDGPHSDFLVDGDRHWRSVAIGIHHTCALDDSGVYCFGTDDRGALGSFEERRELPQDPLGGESQDALHLVAGDGFSCDFRINGHIACWGSNSDGELGNKEIATVRDASPVPPVMSLTDVLGISAGNGHSCALVNDAVHHAYCWGDNRKGQIVPGGDPYIVSPVLVSQDALDDVAAGGSHTCARDPVHATVRCWGDNASNQLGTADGIVDIKKVGLPSASDWTGVAASERSTCARTDTGELVCWGDLPGTAATGAMPTVATGSYRGSNLTMGGGLVLAQDLNTSNTIAFGADPLVDCATRGDFPAGHLMRTAATVSETIDLATAQGGHHACILVKTTQPGQLYCWGKNDAGQTGAAPGDCTPLQAVPPPATKAWDVGGSQSVTAAGHHTCALTQDKQVWCWGLNERGELGPALGASEIPTQQIGGIWKALASGPRHVCAMSASSAGMSCWGENRFGEVGNGFRFHPDPVSVEGP